MAEPKARRRVSKLNIQLIDKRIVHMAHNSKENYNGLAKVCV